jgi:arylformamidase
MKLFDLSHLLNNQTTVYPGKDKPIFQPAALIDKDGYRETHLEFDSHLGTHIDAPAHMLPAGLTLDRMPVSAFSGKAFIISVPEGMKKFDQHYLSVYADEIEGTEFILFKTGWSKYWKSQRYFEDFPTLTTDAVEWLLTFPLKGIGFDAISADPVESTDFPNHYLIFNKGLLIIENLKFPDELTEAAGKFTCYPLPFENADGSPVRAVFSTQ